MRLKVPFFAGCSHAAALHHIRVVAARVAHIIIVDIVEFLALLVDFSLLALGLVHACLDELN